MASLETTQAQTQLIKALTRLLYCPILLIAHRVDESNALIILFFARKRRVAIFCSSLNCLVVEWNPVESNQITTAPCRATQR